MRSNAGADRCNVSALGACMSALLGFSRECDKKIQLLHVRNISADGVAPQWSCIALQVMYLSDGQACQEGVECCSVFLDSMHAASPALKLWGRLCAGSWFAASHLLGTNSASTDLLYRHTTTSRPAINETKDFKWSPPSSIKCEASPDLGRFGKVGCAVRRLYSEFISHCIGL